MLELVTAPEYAGGLELMLPGVYYDLMKSAQMNIIADKIEFQDNPNMTRNRVDLYKHVRKQLLEESYPNQNTETINFGCCLNDFLHLTDYEMLELVNLRLTKA